MNDEKYIFSLARSAQMRALGYPSGKAICPQCGRRTFVYFVDGSGNLIDERCGRCDRENHCSYMMTPKEAGISGKFQKPVQVIIRKPFKIPLKYVMRSSKHLEGNTFVRWVRSLPWSERQRDNIDNVLIAYHVGRAKDGSTIFWQIDGEYNVRSGKIMRYLDNGHRDKKHFGTWVHSRLVKDGVLDEKTGEYVGCLFGEHLCKNFRKVLVVESEKSAILCAVYYGLRDIVFVATGGKGNFNKMKLFPLIDHGKTIFYCPDADAVSDWDRKAMEMKKSYNQIYKLDYYMTGYSPGIDPDNYDIGDYIVNKLCQKKNN